MSCSISIIKDIRREIREESDRLEVDEDGFPRFVSRDKFGRRRIL